MPARPWRLAILAALLVAASAAPPQESPLGEAAKCRILYAGKPGDVREQRFVKLLKSHFARVDSIDLSHLSADKAADYDVVVADWSRRYGKSGGFTSGSGPSANLNADFSKPIIMIGAVGGEIQRHTKLDWL